MSSRTSGEAAPIRDLLSTGGDKEIPDESAARLSGMTLSMWLISFGKRVPAIEYDP
jgi:hypothetical protein